MRTKKLAQLSTRELIREYEKAHTVTHATYIVSILLDRAELGDIESQRFFELSIN